MRIIGSGEAIVMQRVPHKFHSPDVFVGFSVQSEILRLGLECVVRKVPAVKGYTAHSSVGELVGFADPAPDIVMVPVKELDETPASFVSRLPEGTKVLLLLEKIPDECVPYIAAAPIHGYLSQLELSVQSLSDALLQVALGEVPMPHELARKLLDHVSSRPPSATENWSSYLTAREGQVLILLMEGLSNKEIATKLSLSSHSVKRYVTNILAKLHSPNRTSAAARAIREGFAHTDGAVHPGGVRCTG
ncbi:MAG: LuxR C-terminal-related transcriptional regulator [Pseudonocardiaceae bacterium]